MTKGRPRKPTVSVGQVYGNWKVLSAPRWNERGDQLVTVLCLGCEREYERRAYQLLNRSFNLGCKDCRVRLKAKGSRSDGEVKRCASCEKSRSISRFGYNARTSDGLDVDCRDCRQIKSVCRNYEISEHEYQQLLIQAGYRCQICASEVGTKNGRRLSVDHCHLTGKIRGVLCNNCNTAIGFLNDDRERIVAAIRYLEASDISEAV